MQIVDPHSGVALGDPEVPLLGDELAALTGDDSLTNRVNRALSRMILSASGWRTVYTADGNEQSTTREVVPELLILAFLAGTVLAEHLEKSLGRPAGIVVGMDSRPTGPVIAHAALRGLLRRSVRAEHASICASPEIMAYAAEREQLDGFFYVSASHNPVGHNGLKLGAGTGGVYGGDEAAALILAFRDVAADPDRIAAAAQELARTGDAQERRVLESAATTKPRALAAYRQFCRRVVVGPGPRASDRYDAFRRALREAGAGVVGDLNGSARSVSIDRKFLSETGCRVHLFHDTAGEIAHQIVPEGAGLEECRQEVERLALAGERYELGYVPDNDGDRGNLVVYDSTVRRARPLEAQEVFALACVAELAWLGTTGELAFHADGTPSREVAVVVNGPTSMRVERIAAAFGATVYRSEVGEANVVALARELREQGILVRILGEGSNGGNITYPSSVRDPLHTIHSVLKLLYTPAGPHSPAPLQLWLDRGGSDGHARSSDAERSIPDISGILETLPPFTTTSAFEDRAIMRIASASHVRLKAEFESLLPAAFERIVSRLPGELGIEDYRLINYERTRTTVGPGNRSGSERGGLKVLMMDRAGVARAFAWMRGSGTEPVFRVMADVEGVRPETEAMLLAWLRELVEEADSRAAS